MAVLLEAREIVKRFGGLVALDTVSFAVEEGHIHGIIGPNGAGKSTVFNALTGIYPATAGQFLFKGREITRLPTHAIVGEGIARTFQITRLFTGMSVLENVIAGQHLQGEKNMFKAIFSMGSRAGSLASGEERARTVLETVGLEHLSEHRSGSLSYGDQRRLAIAIALASEPELLLLDEPAAGMNPEEKTRMAQLIRRICAKGTTIMIVEHDMRMIMRICDRITVLDFGKKIAEGTPAEIAEDEQVIAAYLGRDTDAHPA